MSSSIGLSERRPDSGAKRVIVGASKLFNPLVLRLAGTRLMPLYGVLEHRGRRSGRAFHTPVVVRPTGSGFVVPMPWGDTTDWYRNIQAAGGCNLRWKGRTYCLVEPAIVDTQAVGAHLSSAQRVAMARLGIRYCLQLRFA